MRSSYLIGTVAGCGLAAMVAALTPRADSAFAEEVRPATAPTTLSSRAPSVDDRVTSPERLVRREHLQPSLAERVAQLERKVGRIDPPGEPAPVDADAERLRRSLEALERTTRSVEARLASLEQAHRSSGLVTPPARDLLELERIIDRLSAKVDDIEYRVRRLELSTER